MRWSRVLAVSCLTSALAASSCGDNKLKPVTRASPDRAGDASPGPGGPGLGLADAANGGAADTGTCAAETVVAERTPADLLFLVDVGPDIHKPFAGGTESKFLEAKKALFEFVMDPRSAGLGVGLQTVPFGYLDKPCLDYRDCGRAQDLAPGGKVLYSCTKKRQCALDNQPGKFVECGTGLPPGPCQCFLSDLCKDVSNGMPTTCIEAGECSVSHKECWELGKPCAGGADDGMCQRIVGKCNFPGASCDPTMYEALPVPITDLPAAAKPFLEGLNLTNIQGGNTAPLTAAVKGTLSYLRKRAAMPGARPSALIIVSQGKKIDPMRSQPCSPDDPLGAVPELEAAAKGTPALPTYVIGVLSAKDDAAGRDNLNRLAAAGGTGEPIVLDSADNVVPKLQEALEKVRTLALPCELTIPAARPGAGEIDYKKVNVVITAGGKPTELGYVAKAEACKADSGGWFYDVDPAGGKPTRVRLCPATCQALKGDPKGKADLAFGCATRQIE